MRTGRITRGISLLLGSALIAGVLTYATGVDSIGTVAISSIVAFIGGMYFDSGWRT